MKQAQKHGASAQAEVTVISKIVAKVMLSSLLTNYPPKQLGAPLVWLEGRGHDKSNCLENALAGFGRSLLLALLPPFSHSTNPGSGTERLSHKPANPARFSTVCASGCQPGVLLLDLPCWTCSGCLSLPNTAKGAAFHPALSWDCPRTQPGLTPDFQMLSLSAAQPGTSQVFPQVEAGQWQGLQDSSWLEHLRAGTDRELPESEIQGQETFTMDLGGSKHTLHLLPGLAIPMFALTDASSSLLHHCVNLFHITHIFPLHPLNCNRFIYL